MFKSIMTPGTILNINQGGYSYGEKVFMTLSSYHLSKRQFGLCSINLFLSRHVQLLLLCYRFPNGEIYFFPVSLRSCFHSPGCCGWVTNGYTFMAWCKVFEKPFETHWVGWRWHRVPQKQQSVGCSSIAVTISHSSRKAVMTPLRGSNLYMGL